MSYVIYHKETTKILFRKSPYDYAYETEAAAKAGLTRAAKKAPAIPRFIKEDYAIAESRYFFDNIEKKEIRRGIAGSDGKEFEVGVNTPWTSGPWSETYWCS